MPGGRRKQQSVQLHPPVAPAPAQLPSSLIANIRPPPPINVNGDRAEEWTLFDQQFAWFSSATSLFSQPESVQIAVFMSSIGPEAVREFNSLKISSQDDLSLNDIRSALQTRFAPKSNHRFERYQFNKLTQDPDERFDAFLTRIMSRAKRCNFGELLDDLVVDRIIFGIRDDALRAKLLDIDPLTLAKASVLCRNSEACHEQVQVVKADSQQKCNSTTSVSAISHPPTAASEPRSQKSFHCRNCATSHPWRQCPAYGKICPLCNRKGHYSSTCRSAQPSKSSPAQEQQKNPRQTSQQSLQKSVSELRPSSLQPTESEEQFFVNSLTPESHSAPTLDDMFYVNQISVSQISDTSHLSDVWLEEMLLPNGEKVALTLDTAARCNVLPLHVANKLKNSLQPSAVRRILSFSDGKFFLNVLGEVSVDAQFISRPGRKYSLSFLVVAEKVSPILGLKSCTSCGFVRRVLELSSDSWAELKARFAGLFTGLGYAPSFPYDIVLVENPQLSVCPARRIPYKLYDPVKKELDYMENLKVIRKITHPTPVVSPMVLIRKGGKIKIGIDPSELNKNLKRHHHPLKTVEEVAASVEHSTLFTVLDCFKGYWQIPLTPRTQDYLTFSTPWGRYSCLRLPYGIASAPEIFQRIMSSLFQDMKNVEISMDDILVHAATEDQLKNLTRTVLYRIQEAGFKLNPQKCIFGASRVKFLGHIFSDTGLHPDPSKIEGILALNTPSSVQELQRFLGSVTYLGKFIENLSALTEPLRQLLKKDVTWSWQAEHTEAFEKLKTIITSSPVLQYYDVSKPVVLSVDSSSKAMGAVLMQEGKPVAYATKALSDSQSFLPQIEKEALAVRFACAKFHQYVFGKSLTIETDHKPLETIFKKPIYLAPPRLKRILFDVIPYSPTVVYKRGTEIPIPDMLSRDCNTPATSTEIDLEVLIVLPVSPSALIEFQEATRDDPELKLLKTVVTEGWPEKISKVPVLIRKYFHFREEIFLHENVLLKSDRIIVPSSLRKKMLLLIHQGHLGATSCITRAKTALFWTGMADDIIKFVSNCSICQSSLPNKPLEPLLLRPIPERLWQIVATDIFQIGSQHFLLIVDSYSGFTDYTKLSTLSSMTVIEALKNWFAVHGIPDFLDSDGGPQYASAEFRKFATEWSFTHRTSSPHYPRSNGLAERNVATIKNILLKCSKDHTDPRLALLNWRNTPRSKELKSPNERLMGRLTKTLLPVSTTVLAPKVVSNVPNELSSLRQRQKDYADQHTREQPSFSEADTVLVKVDSRNWVVGRIVKQLSDPRSYVVETPTGQLLRRNTSFLRKTSLPFEPRNVSPLADPVPDSPPPVQRRSTRNIRPPNCLNL